MMILLPIALAVADKAPPKCGEGFNCWQRQCVGIGPGTTDVPRCDKTVCLVGGKEVAMQHDKDGRLYCGVPSRKARR